MRGTASATSGSARTSPATRCAAALNDGSATTRATATASPWKSPRGPLASANPAPTAWTRAGVVALVGDHRNEDHRHSRGQAAQGGAKATVAHQRRDER
jgi:hypothetical protein